MRRFELKQAPMKMALTFLATLLVLNGLRSVAMAGTLEGAGRVPASGFKVGLVLDKGGKDDKSFNSAAVKGATEAMEKLKIGMKYVEATDDNSFEPMLRSFASRDYDLIVAVGVSQADAVRKVARLFPAKKFAIVDAKVDAPNVRSLVFEEHEGAYLMGALAALTSKTGTIGFVGGMDIPLIRRFELGYEAGARSVNPKIRVESNFVGVTGDAWNNPAKAKELALSQYSSGADVIFGAAGASGNGIFDAAEERNKLAIGVDSNQDWIKPGHVLSSMLKRVDVAVYDACKDAEDGKFTPGTKVFGLANHGVDYVVDQYNRGLISTSTRSRLDKIKAAIVAGRIRVPDYYVSHK